jgi:hypothetical protein
MISLKENNAVKLTGYKQFSAEPSGAESRNECALPHSLPGNFK